MATILVVDDHPANRDLLVTLLEYQHHRLIQASDGIEALELTRMEHPDLVISDVLMPNMDGFEYVRQLRLDAEIAATTVVFYTSTYLEPEARRLAEVCGVKYLLIKPVEPEAVFTTIAAALGESERAAHPPPEEEFGEQHIQLMTNKLVEKVDELESANAQLISEMEQRQKAEETLRESEEHYRLLFENNPLPMWVYDMEDLRFMAVNNAAVNHYGYTVADFLSMPLTDLYPTTELQRLGSNLNLLHQPPEQSGPWIHRKKDGSRIAVDIISHGMVFQKRAAQLVLSNDITDRLRAESETRQRMTELEAINRISIALRSAQTLDEMLPPLLDEVLTIVDGAAGGIWFRDPGGGDPRLITAKGWTGEGAAEATRPSLIRAVLTSGSPIHWTEDQPGPDGHTGPAGAGLPLRADHEIIGALLVHTRHNHPISDPDLRLLSTLTEIAGNAIQRTHLYEQTQKRLQRIAALHVIDTAISSNMFLPETLNILLDQVLQQLEVDAADVLIFDRLSQRYEFVSGRGFRTRRAERIFLLNPPLPPENLPFDRMQIVLNSNLAEAGFGVYPNDFPHPTLAEAEGFLGYARVPLFSNGVINGYLEVYQRQKLQPDSEWLSFFETLAGQAQIAIDNATLLHNLQRSNRELTLAYDATIEGWSRALDLRDRETEGHTQRVTQMVMKLAQALNIPEAELAHIRRGALLHDIGKLGIPDNILLKPGPLTDDEWEIMRRHPIYAYEMLAPIPYLRPALDIPYCHHEKWDGSGYPRHLQGEQIPLAARLFAVTDVWDALRSDRPYRSGWPMDRLRDYMHEQSGSHFDPMAVNLFFDVVVQD